MNENEIRDVLKEGIGEQEPPVTGGPAAVFAGARSHVARTRTLTGALSVVAVLGVAAGAVALGSGGSHGTAANGAQTVVVPGAAATDAAPKASPTTAPTTAPSTSTSPPAPATSTPTDAVTNGAYHGHGTRNPAPVPAPGQVLTDGRSVGELVKSMLPAGLLTANHAGQDSYQPAQFGVRASALMSADDGSGKLTTVDASIDQNNHFAFKDVNCPTTESWAMKATDCQTFPQPDGSVVLTYRTDDLSPTNGPTAGTFSLHAERAFPNGMEISVATSNYFDPLTDPHEKGWHVSPSRSTVLLTSDQLKAMVLDSRWSLTVSTQYAQQARADLVPYVDETQKS